MRRPGPGAGPGAASRVFRRGRSRLDAGPHPPGTGRRPEARDALERLMARNESHLEGPGPWPPSLRARGNLAGAIRSAGPGRGGLPDGSRSCTGRGPSWTSGGDWEGSCPHAGPSWDWLPTDRAAAHYELARALAGDRGEVEARREVLRALETPGLRGGTGPPAPDPRGGAMKSLPGTVLFGKARTGTPGGAGRPSSSWGACGPGAARRPRPRAPGGGRNPGPPSPGATPLQALAHPYNGSSPSPGSASDSPRASGSSGGDGRPCGAHDYPRADRNFMSILDYVTNLDARVRDTNILDLDDPELMKLPGGLSGGARLLEPHRRPKSAALREYILKGGFV
jgi:hypothetical protein